jgi:hypothetical protein
VALDPYSMILEFQENGSLYKLLHDYKKEITWPYILTAAQNIAEGLQYMHGTWREREGKEREEEGEGGEGGEGEEWE